MLTKPISELTEQETSRLLDRSAGLQDVMNSVNPVLEDIKRNGDAALRKYTLQFDRANIEQIEVSHKEIHEALFSLDKNLISHLKKAASNIRAFHEAQISKDWIKEFTPGIRLGQRIIPLEIVGAYIPGGKASYPSTALMTVIPAKVAGVDQVIV